MGDYATLIETSINVYQSTFEIEYLNHAQQLAEYVFAHFRCEESSLFYTNSDQDDDLFIRSVVTGDNVIPSPNAIMADNLIILGHLLNNPKYIEHAKQMLTTMATQLSNARNASFYARWHQVAMKLQTPPYEIAIVGKNYKQLLKELQVEYHPNTIYLGGETEGDFALLKNKLIEGQTTIYVCQNKTCKQPVTTSQEALIQLQ